MKLKDLIPTSEQLEFVQGIEKKLLQRKRTGVIVGGVVSIAGGIIQILINTVGGFELSKTVEYLGNFIIFISYVFVGKWDKLKDYQPSYELAGIFILGLGLLVYFLLKRTSFLLKESEEPFRYTFWVEPFKRVKKDSDKPFEIESHDRFHEGDERIKNLLHHDLAERLNGRIGRLSLLDESSVDSSRMGKEAETSGKDFLISHIHISGHYTIRKEKDDEEEVLIVQVMPQIRIGPSGTPATLASPVRYPLKKNDNKYVLGTEAYYKVVERVYSSIATETYQRIRSDIEGKVNLFPTSYLRAVALFYEAEDFARSNTIDAYDQAIDLYKESLRYFNLTEVKSASRVLLRLPMLWGWEVNFQHVKARVQIGYAKCLNYRRQISALSGRYRNPLFEIRSSLKEVIRNLLLLQGKICGERESLLSEEDRADEQERQKIKKRNRLHTSLAFLTFPKDSWLRNLLWRSNQLLFGRQNRLLFDAYIVSALTHYQLDAFQKARDFLDNAKAVNPQLSEVNALYLLTAGAIEPDIGKAIPLFRRATEMAPNFQIAQYLLAYYSEMRFRVQNEIVKERAKSVIEEYDKVLDINPGNIAALVAQGYLRWLVGDLKEAKQKFDAGRDVKAMVRQTFIGELNYGLARIAAEEGDFNESYDLFNEAISADPGVGAYSVVAGKFVVASYYDYINSAMLDRYGSFKKGVEEKISQLQKSDDERWKDEKGNEFSKKTVNVVYSFVLNDYGNACLNCFIRFGDQDQLDNAIKTYEQAREKDSQNMCVAYNLHKAYALRNKEGDRDKSIELLTWINKYGPIWPVAVIALARSLLMEGKGEIRKILLKIKEEIRKLVMAQTRLEEAEGLPPSKTEIKAVSQGKPREISVGIRSISEGSPEISGLETEVQKRTENAQDLFKDGKDESEEYIRNVLPEVRKIIKRTKLSTIYEGFDFNIDGEGIRGFLSKKIERERLDENDVEALRVWAEVLSSNYHSKNGSAQSATEELCNYIQENYYPDNFDVNLILQDMYQYKISLSEIEMELEKIDRRKEIEEFSRKIKSTATIIKQIIEKWLDQDPIHYASLGWASDFFKDEPERLFAFYGKASLFAPSVASYHTHLGEHYRILKKWEEAEMEYQEAIALDPDNAVYQNGLGNIYFESAAYEKSVAHYTKAIEVVKKKEGASQNIAVFYGNLGGSYEKLDQWRGAEKAYVKALEFDKKPDYECKLGLIYEKLGKWNRMIEHCGKAVELRRKTPTDPYGLDYYYGFLAEAYFKAGRLQEFENLFEGSGDLKEEPEKKAAVYNRIGNLFFSADKNREAIPYYEKAINLDSKRPVYESNLGRTYSNLGELEEMIRHCRAAVDLRRMTPADPYGMDFYYEFLAEAYFKAGRPTEFENLFEGSGDLKEEPEKKAAVYSRIGGLFFERYKDQESIEYLRKAIELAPKAAKHHASLGAVFRTLKKWEEAKKAYQEAIQLNPDNSVYYNELGNIYFDTEVYQESVQQYRKAIDIGEKTSELTRNLAVYYSNLGGSYRVLKEWEEARKASREACRLEPENSSYQNGLGNIYFESGAYKESIRYYQRAIKLGKKTGEGALNMAVYYGNLGGSYKALKNWKEAKKAYAEAIKLNPDNAVYQNALGNIYFDTGGHRESIVYYQRAIEIGKKTGEGALNMAAYHANLGDAYKALRRLNEAKIEYHQAVLFDPNNATFQNALGIIYHDLGKYEESLPYYRKAIENHPTMALYHANLGTSYGGLGLWEEAQKAYSEANKLDNQPIYECYLGQTYGSLGDFNKMVEHCKKAVALRRKALTDPYELDYYYNFLAEAYFKANRLKELGELFKRPLDLEGESEKKALIYNRIGNLLAGAKQNQDAIPYYEEAIDLDGTKPIYECNLGLTYGGLGQWDKMIEHCGRAVELRKKIPTDSYGLDYYYEYLAEAYFRAKRLSDFEILFEGSGDLEDEPEKKATVYNRIGNLFFGDYQNQEAIPYYEKAIGLDHARPIYECNLGLMYGKLGQWGKAIEHYTRAVELRRKTPTDPDGGLDYYYNYLAEGYFRDGRLKELEELFEASGDLRDEPEKKAVLYNRIGNFFFGEYKNKESIPHYAKAIELAPHVAVYYANLGGAYRAIGLREEAREAYLKAVALEPGNADYQNRLGLIYYELGRFEESLQYYAKAIEINPNFAVYHANLGTAFKALGQWEKAEVTYLKVLELEPVNPEYQYRLGLVYFHMGDYSKAAEYFEKAIALKPDGELYISDLIKTSERIDSPVARKNLLESALGYAPENIELKQAVENLKNSV